MATFLCRSAAFLTAIFICAICWWPHVSQSEGVGVQQQVTERDPAEALAKLRVNDAISRLSALADEAQTFDPSLRSQIQTQVASLVWNVDKLFARDLFLKAWEAAESADRELWEKVDSDAKSSVENYPHDTRRGVLSAAWQKDALLGEELLTKMIKHDQAWSAESADLNVSSNTSQANKMSRSELERINVATQLLRNGQTQQAANLAGDALNRVVPPALRFLSELREKNVTAADELYVSLLERLVTDSAADANTVSLLSSYVFSPYIYVTIGSNGFPRLVENTGPTRPVGATPNIRSMFLNSAAQVLLRTNADPTAQRITYMVATRLLPLFDRFTPNLAQQIRSRISELSLTIPSPLKSPEVVNNVRRGLNSTDPNESIQEILSRANQLTNQAAKNRLYVRAATLAAELGDGNATKILQELDSEDLRDRVRVYVFMLLAMHALKAKDAQKALEFARSEHLPPMERVWIYTQGADLIRTKRVRNRIDVIMEAVPVARRIDATNPNKVRALTGITFQLMRYNSEIAKPYLIETIMAANKVDNLNSEDTMLQICLETPLGEWATSFDASNFALKNLFRELAKDDFFQAVNLSGNLKNKEARAVATIAIAEVVLKKNVATP
jgi:hypothetical protein